jgi:calcium permeable stress-gated cation channel
MILNVPKKLQSDGGLQGLFAGLQIPYPTTSVHIGHRVGQLPELIDYHNDTVRSLEKVLVGYLKGGKLGKKRPTMTIGGFMGFGGEKKVCNSILDHMMTYFCVCSGCYRILHT